MNNLIEKLQVERDRYLKQVQDANAAAEADSSAPFPAEMVDHDQGMADGLDRAINIINMLDAQGAAEEEYMQIRWNQIDECMVSDYYSRKRVFGQIYHHNVEEFVRWMDAMPKVGECIVLRSMVVIRVQ